MKLLSAISFLLAFPTFTTAEPIDLGTASSFAVIAATTITNTETGLSVLTGDVGLSPGTSITGFPPGLYTGTLQIANGVALQAQADALTAYNVAAGLSGTDLSGQDLGGQSLAPGVYSFSSSAQLTGTLTLAGDANAEWVFQIGSTLTTGSNARVEGGGCNVVWAVGSSATLGTGTQFRGVVLAKKSVTATFGVNVVGKLVALEEAVTLDGNEVGGGGCEDGGGGGETTSSTSSTTATTSTTSTTSTSSTSSTTSTTSTSGGATTTISSTATSTTTIITTVPSTTSSRTRPPILGNSLITDDTTSPTTTSSRTRPPILGNSLITDETSSNTMTSSRTRPPILGNSLITDTSMLPSVTPGVNTISDITDTGSVSGKSGSRSGVTSSTGSSLEITSLTIASISAPRTTSSRAAKTTRPFQSLTTITATHYTILTTSSYEVNCGCYKTHLQTSANIVTTVIPCPTQDIDYSFPSREKVDRASDTSVKTASPVSGGEEGFHAQNDVSQTTKTAERSGPSSSKTSHLVTGAAKRTRTHGSLAAILAVSIAVFVLGLL
ncbi:hypothetical protein GLAREA_12155 [Glarea lozoyensis ATCC 20868]|uniref:Uncharacterized protein n=1 Tax=Glarea lozoyensis (strain ATCC 20868 / MF5171) TaxID=1116229 RepID=S3E0L2_GLAL2|nr:uncharacterized protein GLAREA_12155 [Glarea lozoyensis ATCC 20868]EPE32073.1 hypothetical protein GLAREA_12155 [Glarea lozoyensis ATCC 20868]